MVVAVAVGAVLVGDRVGSSSAPSKPKAASKLGTDAPGGYKRFRDPSAGFSIAHPSDWVLLPTPSNDVKILAAHAGASFSLRISRSPIDIGPESLGPARSLTDRLVREANPVKLVRKPEVISLGGLPGYLYLYLFDDQDTAQRGVHAHYFLFQGKRLYQLVLQALPAGSFTSLVKTFDVIAKSLRVAPLRPTAGGI